MNRGDEMDSNMASKLREIIDNPDTRNMLASLMNSNTPSQIEDSEQSFSSSNNGYTESLNNIINSMSNGNDKRINLLNAIKPYMTGNRATSIDKAIRILKLTQLSSFLKDI